MYISTLRHLLNVIFIIITAKTCTCDLPPPVSSLYLYSPGEVEYTDVLVRRLDDNLTLVCEQRGDSTPRVHVWNFVPANATGDRTLFTVEPQGLTLSSTLTKLELQASDSGHYMCSAPPFSVTKYILVQTQSGRQCARGAFSCGARCVLPAYVCDGRADCRAAEDEDEVVCRPRPCARPDRLNCSSGRCVPAAACCVPREAGGATPGPLCRQPACCDEHPRYSRLEGYMEVEYPPLYEDRHAPDDYGFIQSTIYTVTACALIFMIAVVLLVSAICKMHMKRAALRSYAHADRTTRRHYGLHYAQVGGVFPPCYEAARLLDARPPSPAAGPPPSDSSLAQCEAVCASPPTPGSPAHVTLGIPGAPGTPGTLEPSVGGFGLARLSSIFSSRYRQVPTQCCDVEMTSVVRGGGSPRRGRAPAPAPACCELDSAEFYFTDPRAGDCGRDLNYMAAPVERDSLRRRPITLQVGRFQLSIPRLGRPERRPDTPDVCEGAAGPGPVRLCSDDTYTLNGRTIRLLGADFEDYPRRPPPYADAVRYKRCGPPPQYLSRDGLHAAAAPLHDHRARDNVELPPDYADLDANHNPPPDATRGSTHTAGADPVESIRAVMDHLPAIDCDLNANETPENVDDEVTLNGN
ncbi:uncharacterized protein LOC131842271 [Achroia grisella]|uniref:uncharacterized protein LOC131842271 n=1 Tax=Achroia grisella TaxID=688607 RepID=UPI0027D33F70|nr:uncharacterized protein LOC131842271 [Achroia grisella]